MPMISSITIPENITVTSKKKGEENKRKKLKCLSAKALKWNTSAQLMFYIPITQG